MESYIVIKPLERALYLALGSQLEAWEDVHLIQLNVKNVNII